MKKLILLAIAAALTTASPVTAAVTLFADTFDRPNNTDLNAATTGKSGTLGALDWNENTSGGLPEIVANRLQLGETGAGGGWSIAWPDHNFTDSIITDGGEFTVSVDIGLSAASSGGLRFNGFAVGNAVTDLTGWSTSTPTLFASDFFFGYDTTGTKEVKIFLGGAEDFQQAINLDGGATLSVRFHDFSDFNAGTTVNYEAFINGGPVTTGSFTWSGTNENYINLYSNYTGNVARADNFEVNTVPEPTSVALLALGFLGLLRRRR